MYQYNDLLKRLAEIKSLGNVQGFYNNLVNNNPQFRRFVESNKGKSPEQIAKENGIDLSLLYQLMK